MSGNWYAYFCIKSSRNRTYPIRIYPYRKFDAVKLNCVYQYRRKGAYDLLYHDAWNERGIGKESIQDRCCNPGAGIYHIGIIIFNRNYNREFLDLENNHIWDEWEIDEEGKWKATQNVLNDKGELEKKEVVKQFDKKYAHTIGTAYGYIT